MTPRQTEAISQPRRDDLVWYAAYGSNLSTTRFRCYLAGGRPAGAARSYAACADGDDYAATRPVMLDRTLFFARRSSTWNHGGVAFVDHLRAPGPTTYGRAYLLTIGQLLHVAAQENRLDTPIPLMSRSSLTGDRPVTLAIDAASFYQVLLPLGRLAGRPMVTLTGASGPVQQNRPSPAYRETVRRGLRETWPTLTADEVERYLTAAGAPAE